MSDEETSKELEHIEAQSRLHPRVYRAQPPRPLTPTPFMDEHPKMVVHEWREGSHMHVAAANLEDLMMTRRYHLNQRAMYYTLRNYSRGLNNHPVIQRTVGTQTNPIHASPPCSSCSKRHLQFARYPRNIKLGVSVDISPLARSNPTLKLEQVQPERGAQDPQANNASDVLQQIEEHFG